MENVHQERDFTIFHNRVGNFNVGGKTLLLPEMDPLSSHLLSGVFHSHGVPAVVMPTYDGLAYGKEYTSGKECFPCQITLGDVLHYLNEEKDRLGERFDAKNYVYFMPDTDGPCRFGMYNKFQRIVLDTLAEFKDVRIVSLSTKNAYMIGDLIDASRSRDFRKAAYCSMVVGDLLERALWRVRPYERTSGAADELIQRARQRLFDLFRTHSRNLELEPVFNALDEILREAGDLMDPSIPQKPLIGIVGEIYVRSHVRSNQHLVEMLEQYGAEVVNASISEWVNYTTYDKLRTDRKAFSFYLRRMDLNGMRDSLKRLAGWMGDAFYQKYRHRQLYKRARKIFDVRPDHDIGIMEKKLIDTGHFSFDIGGEACLSVAGAMEYMEHGFDGVVNVFPFTCMPSTMTSAILKPLFSSRRFPYMDAPYDGTFQPGRETSVRTFMYQAQQYQVRKQREKGGH